MASKTKNITLAVLALIMCLMISACQQSKKSLPVIRIGHAPHDHHSPLYIAALNGDYFKEHGGIYLKQISDRNEFELIADGSVIAMVIIQESTGGKELVRKLTEHHYEMTFGGLPAMLSFIDKGHNIRIVAPVMSEGAGLVVGKDVPVSNWQDFLDYVRKSKKPVKIGYKMDVSVQNLIFERALDDSGVRYGKSLGDDEADILLLNMYGAKNLLPALQDGLIDGFVTMQPYLALAEESGAGKVVAWLKDLPPHEQWQGHPCCALAARENFSKTWPHAAEALVTLMLRANRFIVDNPEESAQLIAQWLKVPLEVENRSVPSIKFLTEYDAEWNQGVSFWIESMIQAGLLDGKVKDAYESGHLEELIYDQGIYRRAKGRSQ